MSQLHFYGRQYQVPGTWNDLSGDQLIRIAGVLHSNMSVDEATLRIIFILINPRRSWLLALQILFLTRDGRMDFLAETRLLADFILHNADVELTSQLIPVVRISHPIRKSKLLYGPPDKCKKLVFMEFIKAETYYLSYRKHYSNIPARLEALDKLIAVLYRPRQAVKDKATWNGDLREIYNDNLVETRLQLVAKIALPVKYAILLFYESCRKIRITRHKNVFGGGSGSGGNWIDALRSMAGGAIHMETMAMVDADTALYDLDKLISESQKSQK